MRWTHELRRRQTEESPADNFLASVKSGLSGLHVGGASYDLPTSTPLLRVRSSSGNSLVISSTLAFPCVSTSTFRHGGHNWIWTVVSRSVKDKVHCEQEMNKRAVGSRQNNPSLAHKQYQHHKEAAGKACCRHSVALFDIKSAQGTRLSKTHETSHSTTSHLPPNSHAQHSREYSWRQVRKGVRTRSRR